MEIIPYIMLIYMIDGKTVYGPSVKIDEPLGSCEEEYDRVKGIRHGLIDYKCTWTEAKRPITLPERNPAR